MNNTKKNTKEERLKNTKEREREKNPAKINLLHVPAVNHLITLVITDNKYFSTTAVAASSQLWSLLSSPAPLTVSPAAPALPSLPGEYNTSLTLSFSPCSQPQAENAQLTCQREATQSLCPGWKAHSTLHFSLQTIGNNTFKRVHVIDY